MGLQVIDNGFVYQEGSLVETIQKIDGEYEVTVRAYIPAGGCEYENTAAICDLEGFKPYGLYKALLGVPAAEDALAYLAEDYPDFCQV